MFKIKTRSRNHALHTSGIVFETFQHIQKFILKIHLFHVMTGYVQIFNLKCIEQLYIHFQNFPPLMVNVQRFFLQFCILSIGLYACDIVF